MCRWGSSLLRAVSPAVSVFAAVCMCVSTWFVHVLVSWVFVCVFVRVKLVLVGRHFSFPSHLVLVTTILKSSSCTWQPSSYTTLLQGFPPPAEAIKCPMIPHEGLTDFHSISGKEIWVFRRDGRGISHACNYSLAVCVQARCMYSQIFSSTDPRLCTPNSSHAEASP